MDEMTGQSMGSTPDAAGAAGTGMGSPQPQGQPQPASPTGQPTGTPGGAGELLAGKYRTQGDLIKAYGELEKKLGQHGEELGKWRSWWSNWDPIARQAQYDPKQLASQLERAARQADQQGQHQEAQGLRDQAKQAKWGDAITPDDQEKWLNQYVDSRMGPIPQYVQQQVGQLAQAGTEYINRYMDLGIKALAAKIENPNLDLNQLLEQAVNIASGKYDPLEWSKRILTAEKPDAVEARVRKQVEQELSQKYANQRATAGVGAVAGGGVSRPMKPRAPSAPAAQPTRPMAGDNLASARDAFVSRWAKQYGAET